MIQELCSFSYTLVDEAVRLIQKMGRGSLLAKMDLKEAYRTVPAHPADRSSQWNGGIQFIWMVLYLSAYSQRQKYFRLSQMVCYGFSSKMVFIKRYLDDFLAHQHLKSVWTHFTGLLGYATHWAYRSHLKKQRALSLLSHS